MKRILFFILLVVICNISPLYAQIGLNTLDVKLNVKGGEIVKGTMIVTNTSAKNIKINAYFEDFAFKAPFDGGKTYLPLGSIERSCGQWITVSPKSFVLPPKGKKKVAYSIKVPKDVKGEYWGVFIAGSAPGEFKGDVGVSLVVRIACTFLLDAPGVEKKAKLDDVSITSDTIQYNLLNNGNAILFITKGTFSIMDSNGKVFDSGDITQHFISPDQKVPLSIKLSKEIPPGEKTLSLKFDLKDGGSLVKGVDFSKDEAGKITILNIKD